MLLFKSHGSCYNDIIVILLILLINHPSLNTATVKGNET